MEIVGIGKELELSFHCKVETLLHTLEGDIFATFTDDVKHGLLFQGSLNGYHFGWEVNLVVIYSLPLMLIQNPLHGAHATLTGHFHVEFKGLWHLVMNGELKSRKGLTADNYYSPLLKK